MKKDFKNPKVQRKIKKSKDLIAKKQSKLTTYFHFEGSPNLDQKQDTPCQFRESPGDIMEKPGDHEVMKGTIDGGRNFGGGGSSSFKGVDVEGSSTVENLLAEEEERNLTLLKHK